jgi:hypothetical protein
MSALQFRTLLQVVGQPHEDALTAFAIRHLTERGYNVADPNEKWETVGQLLKRLDICYETFNRALKREGRPNVLLRRSAGAQSKTGTGQIRGVCSNAAFDAFLTHSVRKPKSTWRRKSRALPAQQLKRERMKGPKRSYAHIDQSS